MLSPSKSQCSSHGWLDSLAISMSIICAVHCLVTPVLVVVFPILTTTFWVDSNFHLWMLFFVLPTTSIAMFLGCRKHRDKLVIGLSAIGLICLFSTLIYESFIYADALLQHSHVCDKCAGDSQRGYLNATTIVNILGGLFLASGHVRNYYLCRRLKCTHD